MNMVLFQSTVVFIFISTKAQEYAIQSIAWVMNGCVEMIHVRVAI
jgi:hypothetical protein